MLSSAIISLLIPKFIYYSLFPFSSPLVFHRLTTSFYFPRAGLQNKCRTIPFYLPSFRLIVGEAPPKAFTAMKISTVRAWWKASESKSSLRGVERSIQAQGNVGQVTLQFITRLDFITKARGSRVVTRFLNIQGD